jgi:hypothetical protein
VPDEQLAAAQRLLEEVAEARPPAAADDEAPRPWLQYPLTRIVAAFPILGALFGFGGVF